MCENSSFLFENKCYICGKSREDIQDLNIRNLFVNSLENELAQYVSILSESIELFLNHIDPIIEANKQSPFLDFSVETVNNDYDTFSQKIPYLEQILSFKSSHSQSLLEIMDNLTYLKSILGKIQTDLTNPDKYFGTKTVQDEPNDLLEYYFEKIMPPEATRYVRRFSLGKSIKNSEELKIISQLVYQIEMCKNTLNNVRDFFAIGRVKEYMESFVACELNIFELFPELDKYHNLRANDVLKGHCEVINNYSSFKKIELADEHKSFTIKVHLCPICSAIFKKYIKKYETYY